MEPKILRLVHKTDAGVKVERGDQPVDIRVDCQDQDLIRLRQIKFHVAVRALTIKFYILHST